MDDDDDGDLDDEPSDLYSHAFAVSTQLSCTTPSLFLVNKTIAHQAKEIFTSVERVAKSAIIGGKIIKYPLPAFLSLCEQSLFVFCSSAASLSFLSSLPNDTSASIRSVFVTSGCLYADDYSDRKAWSKASPQGSTPFAASLRRLANLQQVGIYVPTSNFDFYCSYGPLEVGEMLRDGIIDVARFLLDGIVDERYIVEDNCYTSEVFGREAKAKNAPEEFVVVHENNPSDLLRYAASDKDWPVKSIFKLSRQSEGQGE